MITKIFLILPAALASTLTIITVLDKSKPLNHKRNIALLSISATIYFMLALYGITNFLIDNGVLC